MASSFMRWSNLYVIFRREVRDHIRDREDRLGTADRDLLVHGTLLLIQFSGDG